LTDYAKTNHSIDDIFKQKYSGKTTVEQSEQFFFHIHGFSEVKENLFRALSTPSQSNTLLIGPISSAKNLFINAIREQCKGVFYFDAAITLNEKLPEELYNSKDSKIFIIEEIDKLRQNDLKALINLVNGKSIIRKLRPRKEEFIITNPKIFATLNENEHVISWEKLPLKVRSYFRQYYLPEFSDEEFAFTLRLHIQDFFPMETIEIISNTLISHRIKDMRSALELSSLIKKEDTEEDTLRVIENWLKYQSKIKINS
jgi:Holliday junction DNA helicase RuvB